MKEFAFQGKLGDLIITFKLPGISFADTGDQPVVFHDPIELTNDDSKKSFFVYGSLFPSSQPHTHTHTHTHKSTAKIWSDLFASKKPI
jgi:hypothetical protein